VGTSIEAAWTVVVVGAAHRIQRLGICAQEEESAATSGTVRSSSSAAQPAYGGVGPERRRAGALPAPRRGGRSENAATSTRGRGSIRSWRGLPSCASPAGHLSQWRFFKIVARERARVVGVPAQHRRDSGARDTRRYERRGAGSWSIPPSGEQSAGRASSRSMSTERQLRERTVPTATRRRAGGRAAAALEEVVPI